MRKLPAYKLKIRFEDIVKGGDYKKNGNDIVIHHTGHYIADTTKKYFEVIEPGYNGWGYDPDLDSNELSVSFMGNPEELSKLVEKLKEKYNLPKIEIVPVEVVWHLAYNFSKRHEKDKSLQEKVGALTNNIKHLAGEKNLGCRRYPDSEGHLEVYDPYFDSIENFSEEIDKKYFHEICDIMNGCAYFSTIIGVEEILLG